MTVVDMDILRARAYLSRVAEPASPELWLFVEEHGPVEAARRIRAGDATSVALVTGARAAEADPDADLDAAQRHDIELVVPESDRWPHLALAALGRVADRLYRSASTATDRQSFAAGLVPPLALWVKGRADPDELLLRSVAVVGSRASTAYGDLVAAEIVYPLARRGVAIVSGGAYGIDAVAHRTALAVDGRTVIVSAGGLDRAYPTANADLYDRACADGLVMSESPPGTAPYRSRFLSRNRLIAAMTSGTLVVEAAARSGARNTAKYALAFGRPLMAVPGPVTSAMSVGCHTLLREYPGRALLVESAADVLAVVGHVGEGLQAAVEAGEPEARVDDSTWLAGALDRLDPAERKVFDGLPAKRPVNEQRLAVRSGVDPLTVVRALAALRREDLVEATDAGYRLARRCLPA